MFIPIGDDNSDRKITPFINYALIALNLIVFFVLQKMGSGDDFTYAFSTVPAEILTGKDIVTASTVQLDPGTGHNFRIPGLMHTPIPVYLTLITGIFMHGGFGHLFGNMLYLFIFGDNLENRLGHTKYLFFYLLTGGIASLSHVFATYFQGSNTLIPCLGASGAISAVLGAYVFLFPQNKVRVVIVYFLTSVPAYIALGAWIVFQVVSGLGLLGGKSDGVAYAAHIGGFIAGFILISFFANAKQDAQNA
jgi:membrane associated rhomboid family serine protease